MTYYTLTDKQKGEVLKKAGEKANDMQSKLMDSATVEVSPKGMEKILDLIEPTDYKISKDEQGRTILICKQS